MDFDANKVSRVLRCLIEGHTVKMEGRLWKLAVTGDLGLVRGPEDETCFQVECSLANFIQMAETVSDDDLFLLGAQSVMKRESNRRAEQRERSVAARKSAKG